MAAWGGIGWEGKGSGGKGWGFGMGWDGTEREEMGWGGMSGWGGVGWDDCQWCGARGVRLMFGEPLRSGALTLKRVSVHERGPSQCQGRPDSVPDITR